MKLPLRIAFFVLASILLVAAQVHSQSGHKREQTEFGVEGEVKRPVPLPDSALKAIREAEEPHGILQKCAEGEGIQVADIPQEWFVASEIRLTRRPSASGLVVRGENSCVRGAHITQFWVLTKDATGNYKVVFIGRADVLEVLQTRTNGYRDLQLVFVTRAGAKIDYVRFEFSDGGYHKSGQ